MAWYNLTKLMDYNATIANVVTTINEQSGRFLFTLFLITIFFIIFITLKRYEFRAAVAASGFICFLLALVLAYGNFISVMWVLLFGAVFALAAFLEIAIG